MAVGEALARGIQLGEARRPETNVEQIVASLPGTRGWQRRRAIAPALAFLSLPHR